MAQSSGRFVFIGGRNRGLDWLTILAGRRQLPLLVFCLREDEHEAEKYWEAISDLCQEQGVPCRVRRRLLPKDEATIFDLRPDLLVVMGWRTLISERILSAPHHGAVGIHESLLPAYRGFAPVNWAVINGEKETGVSLFFLTSTGVDNGDIVGQVRVPIAEGDTALDVYQRTSRASIELLEAHLDSLLAGAAPRASQNESAATYTCARVPEDGLIDWSRDCGSVHNLVRGLAYPYPGAFTYFQGQRLIIWKVEAFQNSPHYKGRIPGRVVAVDRRRGWVDVLAGVGTVRVREVQREGEPRVPAAEAIRSVRGTLGLQLSDLLSRIKRLETMLKLD